jgi:hypothetical protein
MRNKRKSIFSIMFLFFAFNFLNAQQPSYQPIPLSQADSLGILLVQTFEGRIQPTHTLAYDILHKLSKQDDFTTSDGLKLTPMQILVDMMIDKTYWLDQKVIYIKKGTGVVDSLGISGKYASVKDFFNPSCGEKLEKQLQISFAKKDIEKKYF